MHLKSTVIFKHKHTDFVNLFYNVIAVDVSKNFSSNLIGTSAAQYIKINS